MSQSRSHVLPSFSGSPPTPQQTNTFNGTNEQNGNGPNGPVAVGPRESPVVRSTTPTRPAVTTRAASKPTVAAAAVVAGTGSTASSRSVSSSGGGRKGSEVGQKGTISSTSVVSASTTSVALQDTLTPLLDEVDLLFEKSKEIVASLNGDASQMQSEEVSSFPT